MTNIIIKNKILTKGPAQYRRRKPSGSGFVILFAVTLAAILISIALGVANIAQKEIKFGTSARDTNNAFAAADSGIECALFYDRSSSSANAFTGTAAMNCGGSAVALTPSGSPANFWTFTLAGIGANSESCAAVSVDKTTPPITTIVSKGYNVGNASCTSSNPNRIERELEVSYSSGASLLDLALSINGGSVAVSSSFNPFLYPPAAAIDGDRTGNTWGTSGGWNDGTSGAYPDWLEIDFSGTKTLSEIDVYTLQNNYATGGEPNASTPADTYGIKDFQVQYDNGSGWQVVPGGDVVGNTFAWRQFMLSSVSANKIRIYITNANSSYSRLVEVEAWGN